MFLAVMSTGKLQGISKTDKDLRGGIGRVYLAAQVTVVVVGIRNRHAGRI